MKIDRVFRLIFATGCCLALAPIIEAKPGGGNSNHGMGNTAFRHAQKANGNSRMKQKAKFTHSAMTRRGLTNHGNSAFGHRQGNASTRTKGSQNNAYGQQNAALHRSHSSASHSINNDATDVSNPTGTEPGNSAFGHRQGDASTRTTGSQNNAYGKSKSAAAHAKHDGEDDNPSASPAPSPGG